MEEKKKRKKKNPLINDTFLIYLTFSPFLDEAMQIQTMSEK